MQGQTTAPQQVSTRLQIRLILNNPALINEAFQNSKFFEFLVRAALRERLLPGNIIPADLRAESDIFQQSIINHITSVSLSNPAELRAPTSAYTAASSSDIRSNASATRSRGHIASSQTSPSTLYSNIAVENDAPSTNDPKAWLGGVFNPGYGESAGPSTPSEKKPSDNPGSAKHQMSPPNPRRVSATSASSSNLMVPPRHRRPSINRRNGDVKSETSTRSTKAEHPCGFCLKPCKSPSDQAEHEGTHYYKLALWKRYQCPVEPCIYRHHRQRDIKRHVGIMHKEYKGSEYRGIDHGALPPGHTRESLLELWFQNSTDASTSRSPMSDTSSHHQASGSHVRQDYLDDVSERDTPTPGRRRDNSSPTPHGSGDTDMMTTPPAPNVEVVDRRLGESRQNVETTPKIYPGAIKNSDIDVDMTADDSVEGRLMQPSMEDFLNYGSQFAEDVCLNTMNNFESAPASDGIVSPMTGQLRWSSQPQPPNTASNRTSLPEYFDYSSFDQFSTFSNSSPGNWAPY